MAAMAPALTEAVSEAHQRLKLATPSSPSSGQDKAKGSFVDDRDPLLLTEQELKPSENRQPQQQPPLLLPSHQHLQPKKGFAISVAAAHEPQKGIDPAGTLLNGYSQQHHRYQAFKPSVLLSLSHSFLKSGSPNLLTSSLLSERISGCLKMNSNEHCNSTTAAEVTNGMPKQAVMLSGADLNGNAGVGVAVNGNKAAVSPTLSSTPRSTEAMCGANSVSTAAVINSNSGNTLTNGNGIHKSCSHGAENSRIESGSQGQPCFQPEAAKSAEDTCQLDRNVNGKYSLSCSIKNLNSIGARICSGAVSEQTSSSLISECDLAARTLQVTTRQADIESRARRLCKRLQVVQAKQVERHVQQQLGGFVGHSLQKITGSLNKHDGTFPYTIPATESLLKSSLQGGDMGGLDTFAHSLKFGAKHSPSSYEVLSDLLDDHTVSRGIEKLVSSATANLRSSEKAFDSDATESSSGGETDVEEEEMTNVRVEQRHVTLQRRAEWRWAMERAAIISRWTWLQAQVSDLEYRIRQQTDIYRQIRSNKGLVVLGDAQQPEDLMKQQCRFAAAAAPVNSKGNGVAIIATNSSSSELKMPSRVDNRCEMSPCSPSHLLRNVDKQSSRLTQSLGSVLCPSSPSCTPLPGSPVPPKARTPPQQLNGIVNSLHPSPSDSSSLDSSDAEEILSKKQRLESLTAPPSPPDNSCIAARVRPIRRYRKRRLVRSNIVSYLSRKPQRPLTVKCSCEWPNTCILCGCKTAVRTVDHNMPLEERVALLDLSYHPILSFSHDNPLHLQLETFLKEDRHYKLSHKLKALKLSQLKKKTQDNTKNVCQKIASSLLSSAKYGHNKNGSDKLFKHRFEHWQPIPKLEAESVLEQVKPQIKKPSHPSVTVGTAIPFKGDRRQKASANHVLSFTNPLTPKPSLVVHHPPSSSSIETSQAVTASQPTNTAPSTHQQSSRKRRGESSFDINNIVIPMSMAAAARVEKLQYKEILTPSWRIVKYKECELLNHKAEGHEDEELEDTHDEAYLSRHASFEEMERSRWNSWAATTTHRRGSRSSNKGDGRLTPQPHPMTPQPASPDLGFHSLNDLPQTPLSAGCHSPEPFTSLHSLSLRERTRVLSCSEDTRSSTPELLDEDVQTVQPWELRIFPLSDKECESLLEPLDTPKESSHKQLRDVRWPPGGKHSVRTEGTDSGISIECHTLTLTSKPHHPFHNSHADFHSLTEMREGMEGIVTKDPFSVRSTKR
nr:PREDICTED: KAT8 regulatory NSL complex subunit 1-like [Latimeria chalumnae]|eukprot:XP_014348245.1 PREDICTED: KAT8 regulatory NSL complex subunit 1-like [Latimeria chalumnae]